MNEYTIFIGSPDDVKDERNIIEDAINETNRYYNHDDTIPKLNLIKLKTDVRSIITNQEAQTVIDKQIEGKYNVFIGVLWKKFGSPTEKFDSGTEQEFYNALEIHRKHPKSMEIMFYFCIKPPVNMKEIDPKQLIAVDNFKSKLQDKQGLYKEYETLDEFKEIIKNDLIKLVTENISFEEDENSSENDGLIDLMENHLNNFNKATKEMELLTEDIYIFEEELTILTKQNPKTRKETKDYFDSASKTITEFSEKLEIHNEIITDSFHLGVSSFNSILKFHGDLINEYEQNETENAMISTCDAFDEIENVITDLIKIIDNVRPITTKFSKSKKDLTKNLKKFKKEIINMKEETLESKNKLLEVEK